MNRSYDVSVSCHSTEEVVYFAVYGTQGSSIENLAARILTDSAETDQRGRVRSQV